MNYLNHLLDFSTIEEGKKNLEEARNLRDKMGGNLFISILTEECIEISQKLDKLIREEKRKKDNQT